MIVPGLRKLLADIAIDNPENKIAKMVASYYPQIRENMDRNKVFELLKDYYNLADTIDLDTIEEFEDVEELRANFNDYDNRDFRIKSFKASSLKGIPNDDNEYGVDFTDNGIINNAIILANNGVGKSSLFAALEMVYTGEIGERRLRKEGGNCSIKDFENYIQRYDTLEKPKCIIETELFKYDLNNKIFSSQELLSRYSPYNNFISDFDIYSIGQTVFKEGYDGPGSIHELIAKSLGLMDHIDLKNVLSDVSNYNRKVEKNELSKLEKDKETKSTTIINIKERIKDQENSLADITKNKESKISIHDQKLIEVLRQLSRISFIVGDLDKIYAAFKESLSAFLSVDSSSQVYKEAEFIELGKDLLEFSEGCPLCRDSKKSKKEILKDLEDRLLQISERNKIGVNLTICWENLRHSLTDSVENIKQVIDHCYKEKELIKGIKELEALYNQEHELILAFEPFLSDDNMMEYLEEISRKKSVTINDYNQMLTFIDNPPMNALSSINEAFSLFLARRAEFVQKYLEQNEFIAERIIVIREQIEKDKKRLIELDKEISEIENKMKIVEISIADVEELKNQVKQYLKLLIPRINDEVSQRFEAVKEPFIDVMSDYLQEDKMKLEYDIVDFTSSEGNVSNIVQLKLVNENGDEVTPDRYFNTFRYRLFALMISLSLVIGIRKTYKINLPLVMDDLFAGSDFISKNSFSMFLMKVIGLFHKHTPDLPFQFILFTHDDMIFRSAIDAVQQFTVKPYDQLSDDNQIPLNDKTLIGRIFKIKRKTDRKEGFIDVLYRLPKTVLVD